MQTLAVIPVRLRNVGGNRAQGGEEQNIPQNHQYYMYMFQIHTSTNKPAVASGAKERSKVF